MIYNFNSGPAMLPQEVLQQASEAVLHYKANQSILEISHRSNLFEEILDEAKSLLKELCELNDDFEILYLNGGASNLFAMIPMNFLSKKKSMGFVHTGYWSEKAINEAKKFGEVRIIASSEKENFNQIPTIENKDFGIDFLHITTNNTIEGTQWQSFENIINLTFADISSDILSREFNYNQFDLLYASTHKNLGIAGCTVVFIKKLLLEKINDDVPNVFNFKKQVEANSIYSTPNVFGVYTTLLMLRWMQQKTLQKIFLANQQKAKILYEAIVSNSKFIAPVAVKSRSIANIVFSAIDKSIEKDFIAKAAQQGFINIAGHRSAGGFRASIYNAMPQQGVEDFAAFVKNY